MKVAIIIWALLIGTVYAQSKAGFYVVGGKVITVQDTSSRNYLKAIENAGVVPSVTQNAASNFLVTSEKAIGSYSLMTAQYPFIGGTGATHVFNLNNPNGLASGFTLQFWGTVNHSANGIQSDGTTGYADTKINANVNLTYNNTHLSHYSNIASVNENRGDIGVYGTTIDDRLLLTHNYGGSYFSDLYTYLTGRVAVASDTKTGLLIGTRTSSTSHNLFKNGVLIGSSSQTVGGVLPSRNIFLMAINGVGGSIGDLSNRPTQYVSIGLGFTNSISIQQSRAVTFFNSMQNR